MSALNLGRRGLSAPPPLGRAPGRRESSRILWCNGASLPAGWRLRPAELARLLAAGFSGGNARVGARPSMKDEALPRRGSDGERRRTRCGCCGWSCLARPNFFRTCLPPRNVVDRATERPNLPRFRVICTVAYRPPPAQGCLTSRRSLVRVQYRPLTKCLHSALFPGCGFGAGGQGSKKGASNSLESPPGYGLAGAASTGERA